MTRIFTFLAAMTAVLTFGGCSAEAPVGKGNVEELALAIQALGPSVDPQEAERAARVAYNYSRQLAQEYQITDSPIVHNAKIYQGYRERGLCNHWTEDLNKRLKQEGFRTLTVHWAISPPTAFRIIHHSVIISKRGDTIYDGIILDPWRYGGNLYWSKPQEDKRYDWRPRMEVREELLQGRQAPSAG